MLKQRPDDFPKSGRISEGLRPLLGDSVFLTNGETWKPSNYSNKFYGPSTLRRGI